MSRRNRKVGRSIALLVTFTLSTGLLAAEMAAAEPIDECTRCHEYTQEFSVGPVDRDSACSSCHTPGLMGTHPFHHASSNCGSFCHPGWGETLLSAAPAYVSSGGTFASPTSQDTSPDLLHLIHSQARWPSEIETPVSACSSCHLPASCTACHDEPVSATHQAHSSSTNTAWEGRVGFGIVGEDQTIQSATSQSNYCATPDCHDVASSEMNTPVLKENFTHLAYPELGYPEANTVTTTGSWRTVYGPVFTGGQMSLSNVADSTLSLPFTGERAELISDLDPYRGKAEIWIDGALQATIDCYSSTTKYQRVVWSSTTLAPGPHTMTVKALGTKNASSRGAWIDFDALRVRTTVRESVAPWCTDSCHGTHAVPTHTATPGAGWVVIFAAGDHDDAMIGDGEVFVSCTTCHASTLEAAHNSECFSCHPTPYYSLGTWDGSCQQGDCHVEYHTNRTAHWAVEPGCNDCHGAGFAVTAASCPTCHAVYSPSDTIPPVTTSDAKATYIGAAVIEFSITDSGKVAVGTTYYTVDGGETRSGSPAVIAEAGSHTLSFWSVDQAGNVESPPKQATFTVAADTTPPVTTSNGVGTYYQGASITLSATDNGSEGVKATYYSLDGGPTQTGTSIVVPATPGTIPHTLEYWSEDWAGNVETANTHDFTVISGTGTIRLVWFGGPPGIDDWARIRVYRGGSGGPKIADFTQYGPWDGIDDVAVPVWGTPHYVHVDWGTSEEPLDQTIFPAVPITFHGQLVQLNY